ncbi:hypothetical protein GUITHDRAFT_108950 [Guillardia theta CCMP2712]|uniref:Uncharacterized protein n=1 Tax=Guillardia theta (strain CCMP2712) TaxID=905079 RepID=L1J9X8_GUITC|nr:hypothetical protein GUITHDRAFT_108950 [Guillardia theta CCMP2712]EKX45311.1 hypothetical protein GUITHDRAFT_108950 [Guillardia theta CCMP2712]|eukprot:XP_005832291.1 hypothetical protein GUITHDRAFT_108950 [Guillardia theta CCMP2712]
MKMMITRWLRSRDFIIEDGFDLPNGLSIRYHTVYNEGSGVMLLEIQARDLVFEQRQELGRPCKRKSGQQDELEGGGTPSNVESWGAGKDATMLNTCSMMEVDE